jgi:hypothetical protein
MKPAYVTTAIRMRYGALEAAIDPELDRYPAMLFVHSIHTQTIDPIFLPTHTSQSFSKNADLALAFLRTALILPRP